MWNNSIYRISFYPPYIGSAIYLMQRYKLEKQLRKEEKNKKIIVSPMALTNLKETAENICNP